MKTPTNLSVLRHAAGYSQAEFASVIGLPPSTYNRMENGDTPITAKMLDHIAGLLGVPVEALTKLTSLTKDRETAAKVARITGRRRASALVTASQRALNSRWLACANNLESTRRWPKDVARRAVTAASRR